MPGLPVIEGAGVGLLKKITSGSNNRDLGFLYLKLRFFVSLNAKFTKNLIIRRTNYVQKS